MLIGVSDYRAGWPDLENIPAEIDSLADSLRDHGFSVKTVLNPDSDELQDSFKRFIDRYGYDSQNRLLFFFSGHGYTRKQGKKGYLVPADAPDPREDDRGFVRKALSMSQVNTWARQIEAKHALFLFDSCFSGTIFKTRALPEHPPHITSLTAKPVRQFITAGSAGEEVPARSVFVPSLIKALRGEADIDRDSYITGTELGMFLHRKVMSYNSRQTPQYGKIRDPELDEGDFVLVAGGSLITDREALGMAAGKNGSLLVQASPGDAEIELNGRKKGWAPLEIKELAPGTYTVKAVRKGYNSRSEKVLIRRGRLTEVRLLLDEIITTGSLKVKSTPPGARWYLGGAYAGTTPDEMNQLEQGSYTVAMKMEGYKEWQDRVTISAGRQSSVAGSLKQLPRQKVSGRQSHSPQSGKNWTDPVTGMEFVRVEGGCYEMGCGSWTSVCDDDEKPVHEVCVDGFWMGKYEVTQGQWQKVMGKNPSGFKKGDDYPVEQVSWDDVQEYIKKLSSRGGREYRLPTEAEWEFAARSGGREEEYAGGSDLDSLAWHHKNSGSTTHPVGTKINNGLGLYDMSGNVWEWCSDWFEEKYYRKSPRHRPQGPSSGSNRVFRGGDWDYYNPRAVRAVNRGRNRPGVRDDRLGFRLVASQVSR